MFPLAGYVYGVGVAAVFLFIYALREIRSSNRRISKCNRLYECAVLRARESDFTGAIQFASMSIGAYETQESYSLLGLALSQVKEYSLAAEAHSNARRLAGYGPGDGSYRDPDDIAEQFNNECLAHARAGNWEFAYLRASEAISLQEKGEIPRYIDLGDCGSWTRLTRLVAALQHLPATEATELARKDAEWLLANCRVDGYAEIAWAATHNHTSEQGMSESVFEQWLAYDVPRRSLPIQIEVSTVR